MKKKKLAKTASVLMTLEKYFLPKAYMKLAIIFKIGSCSSKCVILRAVFFIKESNYYSFLCLQQQISL